ncbi:hypothetical protein ABIF66_002386 [Bradyrhizobium japonicum]
MICSAVQAITSIKFSEAPNLPICRLSSRPSPVNSAPLADRRDVLMFPVRRNYNSNQPFV